VGSLCRIARDEVIVHRVAQRSPQREVRVVDRLSAEGAATSPTGLRERLVGVADQIEAATAAGISFHLIETSYAADVTQVTWRPADPKPEGAT
jgi:hypothetical protein